MRPKTLGDEVLERIEEAGRMKTRDIEYQEQCQVARWLREKGVLFTCSLGGIRLPLGLAVKAKNMGSQIGTPDLIIFEPRGLLHGLLIEMKRPKIEGVCEKGKTSPEQRDFIDRARRNCFAAIVCYGSEDAIFEIKMYLGRGMTIEER